MALVRPILFQVVGYQDSGKTTLTLKLIERLTKDGLKVATIKHHGHGGKPDVLEQKDSGLHISAGAHASLVEGGGRLLLQAENSEWQLEDKIGLLSFLKTDVILIEGHKREGFQKALLLKDEEDLQLVPELENIKVILTRKPDLLEQLEKFNLPAFHIEDEEGLEWMIKFVKNQANR